MEQVCVSAHTCFSPPLESRSVYEGVDYNFIPTASAQPVKTPLMIPVETDFSNKIENWMAANSQHFGNGTTISLTGSERSVGVDDDQLGYLETASSLKEDYDTLRSRKNTSR